MHLNLRVAALPWLNYSNAHAQNANNVSVLSKCVRETIYRLVTVRNKKNLSYGFKGTVWVYIGEIKIYC